MRGEETGINEQNRKAKGTAEESKQGPSVED